MKRREFIRTSALIAAAASASPLARAADAVDPQPALEPQQEPEYVPGSLIASAPVLQNFAETSIGIAFAVNAMASGYALIGLKPDLSDARKVVCGGQRLADISDKVVQIRVTGLKPSTRYYYRIGADRVNYAGGYAMSLLGTEEDPRVYSFKTAGKRTKAHFGVVNDTHAHWDVIEKAFDKAAALAPVCMVLNGDASNCEETVDDQIRIFIKPEVSRQDLASGIPFLFSPGNHDLRGFANRHLERVWMYRSGDERLPRDWDLGRNYAVRLGKVVLIGMDTGEDKMDSNPRFAGLFKSAEYREAQTLWLKDALARDEIRTAPYQVLFCHIPLFDPDPAHNPGDVFPADTDPQYTTDYALWQRTCAGLWAPLLEASGCQLVIAAHQHRYRYDAPSADRPWAQIVGGGWETTLGRFPTLLEGIEKDDMLEILVHNLADDTVHERFTFKPRTRKFTSRKKF